MTDTTLPNYDDFDFSLQKQKIASSASEIHGILCGCICGGMNESSREWLDVVRDFCLDGDAIPDEMVSPLLQLYKTSFKQFKEGQIGFDVFLPEDDIELCERAEALIEWINGFLSAIGLQNVNLQGADDEIKEAFQDLVSISKMDSDLEDCEENFQAFEEVVEYIRVSAVLCFGEFGDVDTENAPSKPIFH